MNTVFAFALFIKRHLEKMDPCNSEPKDLLQ